ncbi:MAG TPA: SDR family NAD(P)-dependent oxidoreductase [Streptomyces sp.]|nr:SDR family NAD(P)-dependent oxidoreductase [Streptomyces sp.]
MTQDATFVLGATGTVGRRVTAQLQAAGHPVRAASRRGEVPFDWADSRTWEPAVGAASRMWLMAPEGTPVDPEFVACAVRKGVRRIVLLSSAGIETMGDERLLSAERTVRESGVEWTILRPDWFSQNFDEGFCLPGVLAGELALPVGDMRQVFIDVGDIAAVAAAALCEDGHAGRTYQLTGPDALSFADAVGIITEVSGRSVRFRGEEAAFIAAQDAAGSPREVTDGALAAFAALRALGDSEPDDTVLQVTGRSPRSFAGFAAEAASRGAWS